VSKIKEYELMPSTIETIDRALFEWLSDDVNAHTTTNKGWKKVPVIWLSAERNYQIKHDKELRDSSGSLKLPLISIERTSIVKDLRNKGSHYAALPENVGNSTDDLLSVRGGVRQISRRIEQKKTSNFANETVNKHANVGVKTPNKKVVYESILIPLPVYINVTYSVTVKTEYQQQINDILSTIINKPNSSGIDSVLISSDGHDYETFIDGKYNLVSNSKDVGESEKDYEAKISIRVLGYIVGSGDNDDRPKVSVRENAVEVKISRERSALGDINPYLDTDKDYRKI
tara:strand:- start:655 stop:1515 length:861 start_codon:yes stop_codon:yes gene_type:complete